MKKFLKITVAVFAVIILLLVALPLLFTEKIENLIKEEGNKMLNAQFDFKSLDISLIRNFPSASLTLKDFYLKGEGAFENDTLVSASEITATVNLMSIFGDDGYDIRKILLDEVAVKAIVLPDGAVNWDVMKSTGEEASTEESADSTSETSPFRIKLEKLTVNDLNLIYDDRVSDMYAEIAGLDASCSGDFGSSRTTLNLLASVGAVTYRMDGVAFLNKVAFYTDMSIDADLENYKFTLSENKLQINAIQAGLDGWVALTDTGVDMDMTLNSNKIGFKEILSLVPAIYTNDFEGLKTDGNATLAAYAKGTLSGDSIVPEFNLSLAVENAMFQYPSLPAGVSGINVSADVSNPGGSLDNTIVKIGSFDFVMADNPFSLKATVTTPVSDLAFNASADGTIDLGKIKDIYPLDDMTLNGVVNADVSVCGRMSHIEKEQYEKIEAQGSVRLADMQLELEDIPTIDIKKSLLTFTPRYVQLSETTVNIGSNDIALDSKFENYMGYVLKGSTLKGTLNVKSNYFNLNDFMSSDADTATVAAKAENSDVADSDTTSTGIIKVPDNIDFTMQTTFSKVLFDNMTFENINGTLVVKNSKVDMKNLSLNTMGGSVVVNGYYSTPENTVPRFNGSFKLSEIEFAKAYNDLNVVRKLAPIFNGLTGDFSGSISIDADITDGMGVDLSTLTGCGSLSTSDLSLNNVEVIQMVADIVGKSSLKDTSVKDLNIEFTIENGRVNTKPFSVKLGDYNMTLSGSTGLDQTIDYTGEITIPSSAGKVAQLGTVDMSIGGTFTSPKVSINMASLAKKAATQAAESVIDKLLGGSSSSSDDDDSSSNEGSSTADKLINKALDLLKKK